jgi:hypothetical protein
LKKKQLDKQILDIDKIGIFSPRDKVDGMRSLLGTRFYIFAGRYWHFINKCDYVYDDNKYDHKYDYEYYQYTSFEYVLDNVPEDVRDKLLFNLDLFI